VPVLEDCILNGKLRDLEVRTREGFKKIMGAGSGEGNANWRALRGLLRDSYLERSVLMAGSAWEDDWDPGVLDQREPFRVVYWVFDIVNDTWQKISEEQRHMRIAK
jgi:hypothetical protein